MEKKTFYRVASAKTGQGLWYDVAGNFTGLIHGEFDFCTNTALPMPFDKDIVGWLSATDTLEDLYHWFSKEDIERLSEYGYSIAIYESTEYKFHNNHWIIRQSNSTLKQVA